MSLSFLFYALVQLKYLTQKEYMRGHLTLPSFALWSEWIQNLNLLALKTLKELIYWLQASIFANKIIWRQFLIFFYSWLTWSFVFWLDLFPFLGAYSMFSLSLVHWDFVRLGFFLIQYTVCFCTQFWFEVLHHSSALYIFFYYFFW